MKVSHYFRKAAKLIHANEKRRDAPYRAWWEEADTGTYYETFYGMCAAVSDAANRDAERAYNKYHYHFEDELTESMRKYLRPFAPHERVRWGEFWFGRDFSPEAQQLRIMILLMAAEMAEANGE